MQKLTNIMTGAFAGRGFLCAFAAALVVLALAAPKNALAQAAGSQQSGAPAADAQAAGDADVVDDAAVAAMLGEEERGSLDFPSLFFSEEERRAIELALEKGGVLDLSEISVALGEEDCLTCAIEGEGEEGGVDEGPKIPKGPREIELAGVLYFSAYDWTIWLNGERVTPYFIPEEVIKLDVTRNNVYIEWFDRFYDRILRVNLRPHQTFYMDANVILNNQPSP